MSPKNEAKKDEKAKKPTQTKEASTPPKRRETTKAEPIGTHGILQRLAKDLSGADAEVRGILDALLANVQSQDEAIKIVRQIENNNERIERYKAAAKNLKGENDKLFDDLFALNDKVKNGDDLIDLIDKETLFHTESDTIRKTNPVAATALFGKTREFEDTIKVIGIPDCEAAVKFCLAHNSIERIPYARRNAFESRLKYLRELEQKGANITAIHTATPGGQQAAGVI